MATNSFLGWSILIFLVSLQLTATNGVGSAWSQKSGQPLHITVFYESMCPSSIQFITQQLQPACQKLCDQNLFLLDLVPYGAAETTRHPTGRTDFTCQHGPDECAGNKVHACAIANLPQRLAVSFLNCTMTTRPDNPKLAGRACAKSLRMDASNYGTIESCAAGFEGSRLLAENGIRTQGVQPPLQWLPTIFFGDNFENGGQESLEGRSNFLNVVCHHLASNGQRPRACM